MGPERRGPGRPPSASPAAIEESALELFTERGFAETSMTTVALACGIGRTTLFRYFPSKAALVWAGFDRHLARLAELLTAQPDDIPAMTAVHRATVAAFRDSMDPQGLWMKRFAILEETRDLHAEESSRWFAWGRTVAEFVAARTGAHFDDVVPAAAGGAVQGAYVAVLRTWHRSGDLSGDLPAYMSKQLLPVCTMLDTLLADPTRTS